MAVLNTDLIPAATQSDAKVFYLKMKGDYYRYWAESLTGEKQKDIGKKAQEGYDGAMAIAEKDMPKAHPVRLGLALNYSVFNYEILNLPDKACTLAKKAFEEAMPELDKLEEEMYKEAATIMQLLRDNLSLWSTSQEEDKPEEDDAAEK